MRRAEEDDPILAMKCPTCGKEFDPGGSPAMPFCSERCRLIDLGRWLDEGHGLPIERDEKPGQEGS